MSQVRVLPGEPFWTVAKCCWPPVNAKGRCTSIGLFAFLYGICGVFGRWPANRSALGMSWASFGKASFPPSVPRVAAESLELSELTFTPQLTRSVPERETSRAAQWSSSGSAEIALPALGEYEKTWLLHPIVPSDKPTAIGSLDLVRRGIYPLGLVPQLVPQSE